MSKSSLGRRFVSVGVLVLIFAGIIAFSVLRIKYDVEGSDKLNELGITAKAIPESIERNPDGKLSIKKEFRGKTEGTGKQECPT